jgi:hypothetical protein
MITIDRGVRGKREAVGDAEWITDSKNQSGLSPISYSESSSLIQE